MNYVNKYKEHYKVEGDHFGGHAYDAVMLLKSAMEKGGFTPAAIRDQLEKRKNLPESAEHSAILRKIMRDLTVTPLFW